MIHKHISELIGNTPLLEIPQTVTKLKNIKLYAKLEHLNPFGSLKDRIAKKMLYSIIHEAKNSSKTILEASSGNTGKALAILASTENLKFKAITNRIKISEMRMIMQIAGAEIDELPGISDCPDLNDPNSYTVAASNLAKQNPEKYLYTDQYFNELNWQAHYESGLEILKDLPQIDFLFTMLGTTGSSVGIGKALKEQNPNLKIFGVVADAGEQIPGARNSNELWEVGFYNPEFYEEILSEKTQNAIIGSQKLIQEVGILAGPTAGANYFATLKKLQQIDPNLSTTLNAVFVVCDRVEPYLTFYRQHLPELFGSATSSKPKVTSTSPEKYPNLKISATELNQKINQHLIIDIRGNFPYSIGHIPNSINIIDEIFAGIIEQGKTFGKEKSITIICRIGDISQRYASFLRDQGYDAYSLEGGIAEWKNQNFPLNKC